MNPLIIDKTQDTPEVILDPNNGKFSFTGTSIPENSKKFYEPILKWIEEYAQNPNKEIYVSFKLNYFNTASTKYIFDILVLFKEIAKSGNTLVYNWYFHQDDEDMYEAGIGFSKMIRHPFNYVKYSE
jgi:hypothetical protein